MRTTIDLPDELYRSVRARAALKGVSMRELFIEALEATTKGGEHKVGRRPRKNRFPLIHLKHTRVLDLSGFDFDDLLT